MRRAHVLSILLILFPGCSNPGVDSHPEVFKTTQDAATDRLAKQLEAHKELAVSVLRRWRPDIEAKPGTGTTIGISADGVAQTIDLAPIEEQLLRHPNEERTIIRKFLDDKLRPFDFERIQILGFAKVRQKAGFQLVNGHDLEELRQQAGASPLRHVQVVSDLYRVSVIRRAEAGGVMIPVTKALAEAWKVAPADIDAAAMQNLRGIIANGGDDLFETLTFGPRGRNGTLNSEVDPAVVLLPEFLTLVQKTWKSGDNLVLSLPSATGVTFVEEHRQALLDILVPQWKKNITSTTNPLCEQLLLRDSEKISLYAYSPTTQPATKPTTKPAPYIVH